MKFKCIAMILATSIPGLAFAQGTDSYQCSNGDLQRRVEILRETAAVVPCEVHYYKDTEAPGEQQVLWSATNQTGYCEQKVEELVAKLKGWGWDCGPSDEPDAAPEVVDDSEALASGEENESGEDE